MRYSKLISLLSFLWILTITACKPDISTQISGQIDGAKDLSVYMDVKSLDKSITSISNTSIDETGSFNLSFPEGVEPGLYRLRIGTKGADLILDGTENNITVNGALAELANFNYTVTGSPLSQSYLEKINGLKNRTLTRPAFDEYVAGADPLLAIALHFATTPLDPAKHELFSGMVDKLKAKYPGAAIVPQMSDLAAEMRKQYNKMQNKYPVKKGQPAPDISLPGVDGEIRSLSDLKGKLVLLDFWASWCSPCRRANPHVVEMYKKYNQDGFEVFNVSLDGLGSKKRANLDEATIASRLETSKKRWIDAIAKDQLSWNNHVSDLMEWESAGAQKYGVTSIPTTFLIGRDGKIAEVNPRGNLEQAIQANI